MDLGDGQGFQDANEFPTEVSDGRSGLESDGRLHTFLWDALSQARGRESVVVSVEAADRQPGLQSEQRVTLALSWLERLGNEISAGRGSIALVPGRFD